MPYKDPEKQREYHRAYRRKWREEHPDLDREYRRAERARRGIEPRQFHGDALNDRQHYYLYRTWCGMKSRCYDSHTDSYPYYGGRGITVADEWVNDYPAFKVWMLANLGERPEGHSLDRIDNDVNYEPGNVRWATWTEQRHNRRRSR